MYYWLVTPLIVLQQQLPEDLKFGLVDGISHLFALSQASGVTLGHTVQYLLVWTALGEGIANSVGLLGVAFALLLIPTLRRRRRPRNKVLFSAEPPHYSKNHATLGKTTAARAGKTPWVSGFLLRTPGLE